MVSQMKETLKLNVLVIWTWSIFGSPQKKQSFAGCGYFPFTAKN